MTHVTQALDAVDALTGQLQELVQDGRFVPRFFDLLFGLRTALGNARDRFAAGYGEEAGELPIFARVFDRCVQASAIGAALIPDDAAMAHYGAAVQRAVAAFEGDRPATARPALRGALRVRSAFVAGVRGGRPPAAMPEPYYTSLVKLFPVEAVTLYPLAIGIAGDSGVLRLVLIGIITLFVITLRWFGTQEESGGAADGPAIAVSVISFALYAGALGGFGYLPGGPEQTRQFLAFITIMWVALVPFALRRARR